MVVHDAAEGQLGICNQTVVDHVLFYVYIPTYRLAVQAVVNSLCGALIVVARMPWRMALHKPSLRQHCLLQPCPAKITKLRSEVLDADHHVWEHRGWRILKFCIVTFLSSPRSQHKDLESVAYAHSKFKGVVDTSSSLY